MYSFLGHFLFFGTWEKKCPRLFLRARVDFCKRVHLSGEKQEGESIKNTRQGENRWRIPAIHDDQADSKY